MNVPLLILINCVKIGVVMGVLLTCVAYTVSPGAQGPGLHPATLRTQPVGPWGLFQPLADVVKLMFKEDFTPPGANKILFFLAPFLTAVTALLPFAAIPFAPTMLPAEFTLFGQKIDIAAMGLNQGVIADVNVGLLYIFAVSSLAVYGRCWAAGPPITNIPCSGRCAFAPRWSATSWPWVSRSSACSC